MSTTRVRTQPNSNSLLGSRPLSTPPESELILAVGTLADSVPPAGTSDPGVLTLNSQIRWYSLAQVVSMAVMQFVFCLPAEMPGAGETFNWDFLSTVALVFFIAPNPLLWFNATA